MKQQEYILRRGVRRWLIFFIVALVLSGITAFPLQWELNLLNDWLGGGDGLIGHWIRSVYEAISDVHSKYPLIAYGTDWLAFAHLVIAVVFIGPLKDPVRNIWVLQFGMIACCMVFPLALIMGNIRGIPFFWQLIDCSFGVIGFIPLYTVYRKTKTLEKLQTI